MKNLGLVVSAALVLGGGAMTMNLLAEARAQKLVAAIASELAMREAWEETRQSGQPRADLLDLAHRLAAEQSASFVMQNMLTTESFKDKAALLRHSARSVDPDLDGLFCEFGVWKGTTINLIARETAGIVHGFDSFEGLPEDWRTGFEQGHFAMDGLPKVRENVRLHKGWFDESVPIWSSQHDGPLAFVHFDADLYSSTKTVMDLLGHRIVPGTVLHFDEFFNYPGWEQGEFKAFQELVAERNLQFEYIGYVPNDEQVAVRITGVGGSGASVARDG